MSNYPAIQLSQRQQGIEDQKSIKQQVQQQQSKLEGNNIATPHQLNYRPDIDGLRTIAVGIVVIFHAWPMFMPGGFIGVDIFFVISGYLISGIIIKEARKNSFSYLDFYSRRIKRIYPALIVILVFVLYVASRKFSQRPLQITTKTMAASTAFGANIEILTYQKDYFDPDVKTNPLLHLWSLGVQQQFYIIWPIMLSLLIKKLQKRSFLVLTAFTVLSFVFSILCVYKSTKFAFYFPFCRFWQMSVGGLVAYQNIKIGNKIINNTLSIASVILILGTVWILSEDSLFPGFWALIPTLGAACIIQAGKDSVFNKYILSTKPFVFIGKISYSLYLWHWPLLVFSRIFYPRGSTSIFARTDIIVIIAIVLSILTYFLVENRFRFRKQKIVPVALLTIMILLGITAIIVYKNSAYFQQKQQEEIQPQILNEYEMNMQPSQDDFYFKNGRKLPNSSKNRNRLHPSVDKLKVSSKKQTQKQRYDEVILQRKVDNQSQYYKAPLLEPQVLHHFDVANEGRNKQLFIIGDSHARYITHRFRELFQRSNRQNNLHNFPTIVAMIKEKSTFLKCEDFYQPIMELIQQKKPQKILFVYRWLMFWQVQDGFHPHANVGWYRNQTNFQANIQNFAETVKYLKNRGIQVWVATINPEGQPFNPEFMTDENGIIQKNIQPVRLSQFRTQNAGYITRLERLMNDSGANLLDFSDHQCWEDICQVFTPSGYSIYFDNSHETTTYSRFWGSTVDFLTQF